MVLNNWIELKQDFITGDYKSLNDFARIKDLKINGNFKKQTKGWITDKVQYQDQKSTNVIRLVQENQINKEVDRNQRHIDIYDEALNLLEETITKLKNKESLDKSDLKILNDLIAALERVQKGHLLAMKDPRSKEGIKNPCKNFIDILLDDDM